MAKKQDTKLVINQLTIKPPTRRTYDVGVWRSALQSADTGRVKTLYDLFDDLMIDGVLSDAIEKRVDAVINSPLTFQDANQKENPEITKIIDTTGFETLLKTIMNKIIMGRSAGEFSFGATLPDGSPAFDFVSIPAKHIKLENKSILINDTDDSGIPYEGDDHIVVLGEPRQFGLLIKAAPLTIYKRGGFGDYAQWLEIFGMPQRVGKYSSYDPENRRLLEAAMEAAGSAPWIVIPKETEVETTNAGTTGDGAAYNDFRRACNEEILITILGQTLTTMQNETGARSLGEVHKEVEEGKNRSDLRYIQRVLNSVVLPLLEKRGFPVKGGKFIFPESAAELSVSDVVQLSDILEIPVSFLHEKYSIPLAQEGEPIARRFQDNTANVPNGQNVPGKETKEEKKEIKNASFLSRFFAFAPTTTAWVGASDLFLADVTQFFNIKKLIATAISDLYESRGKTGNPAGIQLDLFNITNNALQKALNQNFSKAGIDWNKQNEDFVKQFSENTAVFSAFKNHKQTTEIVSKLFDPDGRLRSFSEFKKDALQISADYNLNWLQTEYNTAVRGARMAVNWKKFEQTKHIYPNLEYTASRSANPRDSHRQLYGRVFAMDDPIWDLIMPPSDWNCKCGVRQTSRGVTELPAGFEWPENPPAFRNNPGKTASFVNNKETDYYKETPESDRSEVVNFALKQLLK